MGGREPPAICREKAPAAGNDCRRALRSALRSYLKAFTASMMVDTSASDRNGWHGMTSRLRRGARLRRVPPDRIGHFGKVAEDEQERDSESGFPRHDASC